MKKTVLLAAGLFFLSLTAVSAATDTLSVWKLRREGSPKTWKAVVPATVAAVLADAGEFGENPLESRNYASIDRAQFDSPWTFCTRFKTERGKGKHFTLHFNALSYRADIFLNGKQIASADETFGPLRSFTFDITSLVRRCRRNRLEVTLYRAVEGDLNHGYVDWNPRPVDESMGILGAVTVTGSGSVRIDDAFVRPVLDTKTLASADLRIEATLTNMGDTPVEGDLLVSYEGGEAAVPVTLAPGANELSFGPEEIGILHVDNPRVWWTWDLGTPELYRMTFSFEDQKREVEFGIRSIERELTGEKKDHAQFILNGRPVLVKGAGWSGEIFMRDTPATDALQASLVKDMGLNCIRFEDIWGKDDAIYSMCDRMGLLAMVGFSCQWEWTSYCGLPETKGFGCINDPASEDLAVAYFHDQVLRLRNHPSVICWLTGSDRIPNARLEERYMEIYGKYEYRPYICSAKGLVSRYGGHSGMKMAGPYEYVGPDYWYLDTRNGGAYGFNTETGVGLNMPQIPSLQRMMAPDALWPLSADWDYHCTASTSDMNTTRVMTEVMDAAYGHANTLEEYVNRGHAIDYDATRAMFEAFRCNFPESTGIIQWMLNSAWPSLYWQLYDFYFVPTSAYYGTKKACEPLQLVYNYKDGCIWGLNETGADVRACADIKMYDAASKEIFSRKAEFIATDNAPVKVAQLPARKQAAFISLTLTGGAEPAHNFYAIPEKNNTYDWGHANWYMTPISEYADMSFVTALPQADIEMAVSREGDVFTVTLSNPSGVVSYQNILRCSRPDGTLVAPAFWSDNFVSLAPGETRTLSCRVPEGTDAEISLQTWNSKVK